MAYTSPVEQIRLGIQVVPVDPFWVQVREAIEQQAQSLAVELIDLEHDAFAFLDDAAQDRAVEELLAQELDGLIIYDFADQLIMRLLHHGMVIVRLVESSLRHARYCSPHGLYESAEMLGRYLAERIPAGEVLVAGLIASAASRLAAIDSIAARHPALHFRTLDCPWQADEAFQTIRAHLHTAPAQLRAVIGLSDPVALAARDAAASLGLLAPDALVVGINGDPRALAAIAAGTMHATVETSADAFGRQAVSLAVRAAAGEPLPTHFHFQPRLVTAENVNEVALQKLVAIADLPGRLVGVNRQQEQRRLAQLETSLRITRSVGALLDRRQLTRRIVELISTDGGYDAVQIFLCTGADDGLALDYTTHPEVPRAVANVAPLIEALRQREPLIIADTRRNLRFPADAAWPETRTRLLIPMQLGSEQVGLLDLHSFRLRQHSRQELVGLQTLADQLAIAIRNAELYGDAVQARAVAEQADRLKTRLLANVSHELRTPLNLIIGYSQVALASPNPYHVDLPPALRTDLGHIATSGAHLLRLINDLLDLAQAEIDQLRLFTEPIDMARFLRDVFESVADSCQSAALAWRTELPEQLPLLVGDPVRLRQVLLNLLVNAQKFTPAGTIVLGAEVTPTCLHLWVADTGVGISEELQARLFEPFVSGSQGERREGAGLGLAISRRLVTLHKGQLTLESQIGEGSRFHIRLPLPTLSGDVTLSPPSWAHPTLLLLSDAERVPEPIIELCQRHALVLRHMRGIEALAAELVECAALAWDSSAPPPGARQLLDQLRQHPRLRHVPLLVYGAGDLLEHQLRPGQKSGLAELIAALHPVQASGPLLIVDDDPATCDLYCSIVSKAFPDYRVEVATGGAAAQAALAREAPSLVLLDLSMPDLDGFALLEQLRSDPVTRSVPVLVVSGRVLSSEDVRRLNYPQVAVHSKPVVRGPELVAQLRHILAGEPTPAQATSLLVKRAVSYIQQHYGRPIARQEIAAAVGVHKDYLSQIFRQELGLAPWDYLTRYRIAQAQELLRETTVSITEVAAAVGFEDVSYFGRVFRREVGCPPQAYREGRA